MYTKITLPYTGMILCVIFKKSYERSSMTKMHVDATITNWNVKVEPVSLIGPPHMEL